MCKTRTLKTQTKYFVIQQVTKFYSSMCDGRKHNTCHFDVRFPKFYED